MRKINFILFFWPLSFIVWSIIIGELITVHSLLCNHSDVACNLICPCVNDKNPEGRGIGFITTLYFLDFPCAHSEKF